VTSGLRCPSRTQPHPRLHQLALAAWGGAPAPLGPDIAFRLLGRDDVPAFTRLREEVVRALPDPDLYRYDGEAAGFVDNHFNGQGVLGGLFHGARLVAYGGLLFERGIAAELAGHLDLAGSAGTLVMLSSAMIVPDCRGRGLHAELIRWRIDLARALGYRHLAVTVSPRNHRSWSHLAVQGIHPKRLIEKGGLVRFVAHRDLERDHAPDWSTEAVCRFDDASALRAQFAARRWVWSVRGHSHAVFARPERPGMIDPHSPR